MTIKDFARDVSVICFYPDRSSTQAHNRCRNKLRGLMQDISPIIGGRELTVRESTGNSLPLIFLLNTIRTCFFTLGARSRERPFWERCFVLNRPKTYIARSSVSVDRNRWAF